MAMIYYLGHSGWAVKTKNHFLIFDYYEGERNTQHKAIKEGFISADEIKDTKVCFFVSHKHHDHYDPIIHDFKDKIPEVKYFVGWESTKEEFIGAPAHSNIEMDDIRVFSFESTDEGVGFLVKVDGLSIIHGGDHAYWTENSKDLFKIEIDYISEKDNDVDILFLPIANFRGLRPKSITEGVVYAINKLKVKAFLPMHGRDDVNLYKEFAEEVSEMGFNVLCAKKSGNEFIYTRK